ncbi:MAG: hypothetical protein NXI00_23355, partial [Cytophagales bacterium]|nr:hypothetical protein [Cytophagales bacterium]
LIFSSRPLCNMNLDSLMGSTPVRERKSKSKEPGKTRKSMRIGALFGRKDSGKKTDNLSAFQRVSEENCVLHPGGSKSPRDVGLRSSTTKRRTAKSVCLASPPNAANIITMSPRTRREKRKKTPAASPQLEAKNKILFIPESDPLYQLQDAYNEHSKCVRDLATIPPLEKRLER